MSLNSELYWALKCALEKGSALIKLVSSIVSERSKLEGEVIFFVVGCVGCLLCEGMYRADPLESSAMELILNEGPLFAAAPVYAVQIFI